VLCYHNFFDEVRPERDCAVHVDDFAGQMQWLSTFADFVTLDAILDDRSHTNRWQVGVTCDDGHLGSLDGLPVLERFKIPMTWFVATQFVEEPQSYPWWCLIDLICRKIRTSFTFEQDGRLLSYELADASERSRFAQDQERAFFQLSYQRAAGLRDELSRRFCEHEPLPDNGFARPHQVKSAATSPWIILGGHTVSHPNMARCTPSQLDSELHRSRELLQSWTAKSVDWFAYPYGGPDNYPDAVVDAVRECGFKGAVTTVDEYAHGACDPYRIPRLCIQPGMSLDAFRSWVGLMGLCKRAFRLRQRFSSAARP